MQEDNYVIVAKRVAGYLRRAKENRNPAAFLTGAGASISAKIPSAKKLVEQVVDEFSHCIEELSPMARADYGKCMSALSPDERRMLIKPHLDNARINWGHIALAQIIKNGFVSRVLTFNFDLVLESALSLIGQQCPVYDFGAYPKADLALLAEPSIIHLHGQSYGFVHLNTEEETQAHKEAISPIITNTINTRPTIIIGYSGDCDPSAKTLQEQYSDQHRLAWLEYSDKANSPQQVLTKTYDYAEFSGGLDFDLFMIALATELQIWPPKILTNSSSHLLDELSVVTDYPTRKGEELDIFSRAKEHLRMQKDDLIMKAAFEGTELPLGASEQERKLHSNIRASQILSEAGILHEEASKSIGEASIATYEKAIERYREVIRLEPNDYVAHNNLGAILGDFAAYKTGKEAQSLCKQAIKSCEASVLIKHDNAIAHSNWGLSIMKLASNETKEKAYSLMEKSLDKFETAIRIEPISHAYSNWGLALTELAAYETGENAQLLIERAIVKCEHAVEIDPTFPHAYNAWGMSVGILASLKSGDEVAGLFIRAIEKIQAAIKLNPKYEKAHYNLGRVFALKRDHQSMVEALEQANKFGFPRLKFNILEQVDFEYVLETDEMKAFLETLND